MTTYRIKGTKNEADYVDTPRDGVYAIHITEDCSGSLVIESISPRLIKTQYPRLEFPLTLKRGNIFRFTIGVPPVLVPENVFAL